MKQFAIAFALGAASALAFQPVGWWPLMLVAFAVLCELIARSGSLRQALLAGWLFGLGQFVVGLNWIATAFTYQAKMPPSLGWIAVVLLSLYLAVFPALATGLAWRVGRGKPVPLALTLAGAWALTEWLRAGVFTGFAWNPVSVTLVDTPLRGLRSWSPSSSHSTRIAGESRYPATSSRPPNGSRVPCTISAGVLSPSRCRVRTCSGRPGGWNG